MKKRLVSLLAALAMLFTLLPAGAVTVGAAYGDTAYQTADGYFKYTLDEEGNATIVACEESAEEIEAADGVVTIPEEVTAQDGNTYPVVAIGDYAFEPYNIYGYETENCSEITEIKIDAALTQIGEEAFSECANLKTINIPKTVEKMGYSVFLDCTSLKAVELPDAMKEVPIMTFSGCSSLENVKLPAGATSIGAQAFYGCESLEGVEIPDTVTEIGYNAFEKCPSLKSITIPAGVTEIPENLFNYDEYNDGVEGKSASDLESVTFLGKVEHIGEWAFYGCDNLKNVTYGGTQDQWNDLLENHTEQGNDALKSETVTVTCTGKPEEPDKPTPKPTPAPAEPADDSPDVLGTTALVVAGGLSVAAGGYAAYRVGTELYLNQVLPAGADIPATRAQLAELMWTDAGKPEPAAPLAEDAPEDVKALTWAVESGLMQAAKKNGEAYTAEEAVSRITVIRTWNKAQELKKAAA